MPGVQEKRHFTVQIKASREFNLFSGVALLYGPILRSPITGLVS